VERQREEALDLISGEANTFIETVSTLRGLKDVAQPQALTLDSNPAWQRAIDRQADAISSGKKGAYLASMIEAMPLVISFLNGAGRTSAVLGDPDEIEPEDLREDIAAQRTELARKIAAQPDFKIRRNKDGLIRVTFDDPEIRWHFWAAVRELERGVSAPTHAALLMRSILAMAVSAFEVLVSNIYRSHLMCNPAGAENPETKAFSLRDLFDFESVQDAIDETIRQHADAFSRRGIRTWATWFKGRPLETDLADLAWDWPRTQELFERRNVVIHNGSRITRQYMNNVDTGLVSGLTEGAPLEITPEYVDESLERLLTLGTMLAYKVRRKLFGKENASDISQWISDEQFKLILSEQFNAVEQISKCADDSGLVDAHRMVLRVNGWIAKMRLSGLESCRAEIRAWDTTALSPRFRAARLVLLREDAEALASLRDLVEENEFTAEQLAEWPLFYWMRQDGVLDDLITESAAADSGEEDLVAPAEANPALEPEDTT
jgi:hypothetical protein